MPGRRFPGQFPLGSESALKEGRSVVPTFGISASSFCWGALGSISQALVAGGQHTEATFWVSSIRHRGASGCRQPWSGSLGPGEHAHGRRSRRRGGALLSQLGGGHARVAGADAGTVRQCEQPRFQAPFQRSDEMVAPSKFIIAVAADLSSSPARNSPLGRSAPPSPGRTGHVNRMRRCAGCVQLRRARRYRTSFLGQVVFARKR